MGASEKNDADAGKRRFNLSLDGWAVALALAVCLLIRFGLIKSIPW